MTPTARYIQALNNALTCALYLCAYLVAVIIVYTNFSPSQPVDALLGLGGIAVVIVLAAKIRRIHRARADLYGPRR
jgi:hypothetical protein